MAAQSAMADGFVRRTGSGIWADPPKTENTKETGERCRDGLS